MFCLGLWRTFASLALSFVLLQSALAAPPQIQTSSPQAATLLQKSLAALVGNTSLSDVTLTGTARRIAGSDDETGSVTLKAIANGSSRLDFNFSSGSSSEVSSMFTAAPSGYWSGSDSVSHPVAFHNLLTETGWFAPGLAIARRLSSSTFLATYVGQEALNSQTVERIAVSQTVPYSDPPGGPTLAHLSQVDFYLDSTTLLPAAISFNIHPDNNALLDLPVQVLFSDYRTVSGVQLPFHVQKFLNNVLALDLEFQSASINSGLSASTFSIQ